MLNYQEEKTLTTQDDKSAFRMATVVSYTEYKAVVQFDGEEANSTKEFKRIYGHTIGTGDRGLCARYGGTYIVLGALKG